MPRIASALAWTVVWAHVCGARAQQAPAGPVTAAPASDAPVEATPIETTPAPVVPRPSVLLVETHTVGIDPVVGRFVNRQLRRSVEARGYAPLEPERARSLMRQVGTAYPPSMADLWRLAHAADAERGVFAVASAARGRYQLQLRVASRDGTGPFYAQGESDARTLEPTVDALVRDAFARADAARAKVGPAPSGAPAASAPTPGPAAVPAPAPPPAASTPAPVAALVPTPSRDEPPQWRVALQTEPAFGLAEDPFYNHLIGARLDYRFDPDLRLGGYVGYANLSGRDGRVASVLTGLQLDRHLPLEDTGIAIPLRVGLGYLWRNGAVARVATGVAFALGGGADLVLDLVAPTFWVTRERDLFSLDLAVELGWTIP